MLNESFIQICECLAPRILTHLCRDPHSDSYGCCDRNWWHYKIRDFPSIILQQGGYAILQAGKLDCFKDQADSFSHWAIASAQFWNARAIRYHAFEEYYPWEQGYPPLAFSTLAVMKILHETGCEKEICREGAEVAAQQLMKRFESQAANQQVAGLAALAWIKQIFPDLVNDKDFDRIKTKTLALQTEEGWFEEYGGPDTGYLSVTIDCLWDLYDAIGDTIYIASACKALSFIDACVSTLGASPGMHNARNTDYIVPYGMARFLSDPTEGLPTDLRDIFSSAQQAAARCFTTMFEDVAESSHFIHATDDRYLSHYIGHSFIRAALLMMEGSQSSVTAESMDASRSQRTATLPNEQPQSSYFPLAGYVLDSRDNTTMVISLLKGGNITLKCGDSLVSDFGWVIDDKNHKHVTNWWDIERWTATVGENTWRVEGYFAPTKEVLSTPCRHVVLRIVSLLFGNRIIQKLKNRLIFNSQNSPFYFTRELTISDDTLTIKDQITGITSTTRLTRAPRSSKRHVASADSFQLEDSQLLKGFTMQEHVEQRQDAMIITTTNTRGLS